MNVKNTRIHVDEAVLRILYYKYKQYFIPFIFFVLSLCIFFFILLAQIQNYFAIQDSANTNRQTIAVLTQNINTLSQLPTSKLQDLTTIAKQALPQDKDFEAVLNGISSAASIANVSLSDYSFQIGDLQSKLAQTGPLSVAVSLSITGQIQDAERFIAALQKEFPLAEVTQVTIRTNGIGIVASFYYAPFPNPVILPDNPLPTFTKKQEDLLRSLASNVNTSIPIQATSSAK